MLNKNALLKETRGRYTLSDKYRGKKYKLTRHRNCAYYYVIDAIIPTFTAPNDYEAFLILLGKRGAIRCAHLFKNGTMKWI